ncbi:MAG: cyclic nucleotide-binding domain-containing protein [Legionellales bacterium]|nr:cyclic nucleotide-binding domain-containing protein [Legionellales bacterium]
MSNKDEIFAFLQNNRVFNGIRETDLLKFVALSDERRFRAGEYISHEGDLAEHLFIVMDGTVEILKQNNGDGKNHVLAKLQSGDTIGELSLIEDSPHAARSASIRAATDASVLAFSNEDLHSPNKIDIHLYNALVVNLAQLVCRRLRFSNEQKTGSSGF